MASFLYTRKKTKKKCTLDNDNGFWLYEIEREGDRERTCNGHDHVALALTATDRQQQ